MVCWNAAGRVDGGSVWCRTSSGGMVSASGGSDASWRRKEETHNDNFIVLLSWPDVVLLSSHRWALWTDTVSELSLPARQHITAAQLLESKWWESVCVCVCVRPNLSFCRACRRRGGKESLKSPPDRRLLAFVWEHDAATHVRGDRLTSDGRTWGDVWRRSCVTWPRVVGGALLRAGGRDGSVAFLLHGGLKGNNVFGERGAKRQGRKKLKLQELNLLQKCSINDDCWRN